MVLLSKYSGFNVRVHRNTWYIHPIHSILTPLIRMMTTHQNITQTNHAPPFSEIFASRLWILELASLHLNPMDVDIMKCILIYMIFIQDIIDYRTQANLFKNLLPFHILKVFRHIAAFVNNENRLDTINSRWPLMKVESCSTWKVSNKGWFLSMDSCLHSVFTVS